MSTNTTNYNFIKPSVNDPTDQDLWGGYLNENWDSADALLLQAIKAGTLSKSAVYIATAADANKTLLGDASGGTFDFELPDASTVSGAVYTFKKTDSSANAVRLDGNSTQTIDGTETYSLTLQNQSVTIVSDGSNWQVKSSNGDGFSENSIGVNGYQKLPSGLYMQWGAATVTTSSTGFDGGEGGETTVDLPIEFPNACFGVVCTRSDENVQQGNYEAISQIVSTSQIKVILDGSSTAQTYGDYTVYWQALGN